MEHFFEQIENWREQTEHFLRAHGGWKMTHEIVGSLLAYNLTLMELKGVLFVIGQTIGCEGKWAKISTSQWAAALRIDRRNVSRLVKNLVNKNLIERRDGSGSIPEYRF